MLARHKVHCHWQRRLLNLATRPAIVAQQHQNFSLGSPWAVIGMQRAAAFGTEQNLR
jgi:hypothetical protein